MSGRAELAAVCVLAAAAAYVITYGVIWIITALT